MGKVFEDNVKTLYGTQYVTGNIADVICKLLLLVAC
jgi:hypothetical protein